MVPIHTVVVLLSEKEKRNGRQRLPFFSIPLKTQEQYRSVRLSDCRKPPLIMSTEYSSLAADSAKLSLKRTRELFDRSATNAFLPSTDARLYQTSLTRRLKTQYSLEGNKKAPIKSSDALVVSNARDNDEQQEESTTAGVLATRSEEPPKPNQSAGGRGILVVSFPCALFIKSAFVSC
jgi:hypothetical protein